MPISVVGSRGGCSMETDLAQEEAFQHALVLLAAAHGPLIVGPTFVVPTKPKPGELSTYRNPVSVRFMSMPGRPPQTPPPPRPTKWWHATHEWTPRVFFVDGATVPPPPPTGPVPHNTSVRAAHQTVSATTHPHHHRRSTTPCRHRPSRTSQPSMSPPPTQLTAFLPPAAAATPSPPRHPTRPQPTASRPPPRNLLHVWRRRTKEPSTEPKP